MATERRRSERHDRLAAADVALHQPMHGRGTAAGRAPSRATDTRARAGVKVNGRIARATVRQRGLRKTRACPASLARRSSANNPSVAVTAHRRSGAGGPGRSHVLQASRGSAAAARAGPTRASPRGGSWPTGAPQRSGRGRPGPSGPAAPGDEAAHRLGAAFTSRYSGTIASSRPADHPGLGEMLKLRMDHLQPAR